QKRFDILFGVFPDTDPGFRRLLDDAIVHIGQVHHLHHPQAARKQESAQNILKYERPKIPDMGEIVDRGPAGVDANLARVQRREGLQAITERVVETYFVHFPSYRKEANSS